jgi:flagellar protein FliO/FliZ
VDVQYVRFVLALLFVLGLIGLLAFVLRRLGLGGVRISPAFRGNARKTERRLSVVEVATVDARHRLVLVRRDGIEHLVLLGANSDLLIESNIAAPDEPPSSDATSFQQTLRTAGEQKP